MVAHQNGSVSKVELSWDQVVAGDFPMPPAKQLFTNAVLAVTAQAKAALPEANGRVERARDLVLGGLVTPQPNYTFAVRSETTKGKTYVVTPEGCECPDAAKLPDGRCKHLLATWIWRKARTQVEAQVATDLTVPAPDRPPATETDTPEIEGAPAAPGRRSIPTEFLVELHGKQFITFGGLLALAHERGLQSLTASFVSVTAELALAHAVATFTDGRTFEESADATPANVNAKIRLHFPRMALTRSKARCLRDALNISMLAVEELES